LLTITIEDKYNTFQQPIFKTRFSSRICSKPR